MSSQTLNLSGTITDPSTGLAASFASTVVLAAPTPAPTPAPAPSPAPIPTPAPSPAPAPAIPAWLANLPGVAGQTYASTEWLINFKYDANGNIDLTPLIPLNACIISTAATPGHQTSDYADFNSAQNAAVANGSLCVLFRDGGIYPANAVNQNIQGAAGTASKPFIVSRVGVNGFLDHSQPRPVLQNGFGIAGSPTAAHGWGGPMHYLIIDGLNFAAPANTVPASSWAVRFADGTAANQSDHFLIADCACSGFQGAIDLEDDVANESCSTMIVLGCSIHDMYQPGPTQAGLYTNSIRDLLIINNVFANCGQKNNNGTGHDVYINPNHPNMGDTDSQVRIVGNLFATAAACGCECNYGGLMVDNVFLADPIAGYVGGGLPGTITGNIVDGGNGEFDGSTPGSALSLAGAGTGRGWGLFLDCATTGTMTNNIVTNKPTAALDQGSGGFAFGVHCTDVGKNGEGMPTEATIATFGPGNIAHDWYDASGSNQVNLSQSTPPLPTITYVATNVLPGVNGIAGVSGTEPAYVDDTRTCSSYARTLGITGVTNGPSLLTAMENNWSGNFDSRLTAASVVDWIQAGFKAVK